MARTPAPIDWKKANAECLAACALARAQGRHSSDCSDWCQNCGQKVKAIYHVLLDGKRICILCAAKAQIRGAEADLKKYEPEAFKLFDAQRNK